LLKSASRDIRFGQFTLDRSDRRLRRDGEPVELSARYFDALALLVGEAGTLVTKDRFMGEVWRGVPVTDEALTQCIKELRRALGDDAASPRFIETVPKHGYRFVAPVEAAAARTVVATAAESSWRETLLLGAGGAIGGGIAGFLGGLVYGFAGASQPLQPGLGAMSIVLVILCLTIAVGLMGGIGVSFGISIATRLGGHDWRWSVAGGALGGLIVGAVVKLLGVDAFNLLFGRSPAGMTGAMEGLVLGAAVGVGAWLSSRTARLRNGMVLAALAGGMAGVAIPLLGGRLMGGSLDLLSRTFPDSRLRLDQVAALLGENRFGPLSEIVTGALEGGLFSACVVAGIVLARRSMVPVSPARERA
jgi:DNA-binding winged helix-turn-helix (wHTH) protein